MIPKIIHFCWFGKKDLTPLAKKCIASWRKFFPDYEIKQWNESNFNVNIIPYTEQAYAAKKYAFVSDYARFWILYKYGGIYFDIDVEVIKSMKEIIARGPFMGCERDMNDKRAFHIVPVPNIAVNPGLGIGANSGLGLYKIILDFYAGQRFINKDGTFNQTTVVKSVTGILKEYGLQNTSGVQLVAGVYIYPQEYFCPIDYSTKKITITPNTCSIHHFASSWHSLLEKWEHSICRVLHLPDKYIIRNIENTIRRILKNNR